MHCSRGLTSNTHACIHTCMYTHMQCDCVFFLHWTKTSLQKMVNTYVPYIFCREGYMNKVLLENKNREKSENL